MKKLIFLPLIFFTVLQLSAQNKYEQESKISFTNVPEKARLFVSKIIQSKKVKWYKEQSNNRISFEAKSKFRGKNIVSNLILTEQLKMLKLKTLGIFYPKLHNKTLKSL